MLEKETHKVTVVPQGACDGCPASRTTLKQGIEGLLREPLKADKLAAEEIPNTEGPANGFLKYSCSRNPLVGIEIPASSTARVLLALMLMIS